MNIYRILEAKAKKKTRTLILPESSDPRVIEAVRIILKRKFAKIILIDNGKKSFEKIRPHKNLTIIDSRFSADFSEEYRSIKSKKISISKIRAEEEVRNPVTFACMLLRNNFGDAVIAGSVYPTSEVLRNAISIIGTSGNNRTVSSFFLFTFPAGSKFESRIFAYADCGIIPDPDAVKLSEIAVQTSASFQKLTGIKPRTAFLSFSTKGSAASASIDKITEAVRITRKKYPGLLCDGELQFDAAFVPEVARRKNPGGVIMGDANVFIFPDLNSGNIAYKITERIGGASATGPIVQGLAKPVMDLSRGCSAKDIVSMSLVACRMV